MTEVEAKFLLRHPGQVDRVLGVLEALDFVIRHDEDRSQIDTYFDTADWAILQAGWAYRCRQTAGASSLTLKSTGKQDGPVYYREEIEQSLPDELPNTGGELPDGPVSRQLATIAGGAKTRKLFSVRTKRAIHIGERFGEQAASIEVDVDDCRIPARKAQRDGPGYSEFVELEIELVAGNADVIAEIAATLRSELKLVPAQLSKFERGIRTAGLKPVMAGERSPNKRYRSQDPALELFFDYARSLFDIMTWQQPVAWEGLDPEGVHQMRVATRRLRALLRSFATLLPADTVKALETELRWLGGQLGDARDADICERHIAHLEEELTPDELEAAGPYIEHLRSMTAGAYSNLADVFSGERYAALITDLDAFVSNGPDPATLEKYGELTVASCAAMLVTDVAAKTLNRGDRISRKSGARKLHKLRIIAKRLRYLLEFFATVQTRKWRKPISALQELHDVLGDHQDAVTARETLDAYRESVTPDLASPELLLVLSQLTLHEDDRREDCRARFPGAWERFRATMI